MTCPLGKIFHVRTDSLIERLVLFESNGASSETDCGGEGWWSDAVDTVKTVAKKVQKNPVVRNLEKRAVKAGSDVLRGAAETAVSGAADSALTALGAPGSAACLGVWRRRLWWSPKLCLGRMPGAERFVLWVDPPFTFKNFPVSALE